MRFLKVKRRTVRFSMGLLCLSLTAIEASAKVLPQLTEASVRACQIPIVDLRIRGGRSSALLGGQSIDIETWVDAPPNHQIRSYGNPSCAGNCANVSYEGFGTFRAFCTEPGAATITGGIDVSVIGEAEVCSASATLSLTCTNTVPVVSFADRPSFGFVGAPARFRSTSYDPEYGSANNLQQIWNLESKPAGSNVFFGGNGTGNSIEADLPGEYVVRLNVSDGYYQATGTKSVTIYPHPTYTAPAITLVNGSGSSQIQVGGGSPQGFSTQYFVRGKPTGTASVTADGLVTYSVSQNQQPVNSIEINVHPKEGNISVLTIPVNVQPNYDFTVQSVRIAQASFNPDIENDGVVDLVKTKPLVIAATIKVDRYIPNTVLDVPLVGKFTSGGEIVEFKGKFNTSEFSPGTLSKEIFLYDLDTSGEVKKLNLPEEVGILVVSVNVEGVPGVPPVLENTTSNNSSANLGYFVHPESSVDLQYFVIAPPKCGSTDCYPPVGSNISNDIKNINEYVEAMFPISKLNTDSNIGTVVGSKVNIADAGLFSDALKLDSNGFFSSVRGTKKEKKYIGLVSNRYFRFHGRPDKIGIRFSGLLGQFPSAVGLVTSSYSVVGAHELTHTYNLRYGRENKSNHYLADDPYTNGAWVKKRDSLFRQLPSYMLEIIPGANAADTDFFWIDAKTYKQLFEKINLSTRIRRKVLDEKILYIQGILSSNGEFKKLSMHEANSNQVSTVASEGLGIAELIDPNGNKVSEILFDTSMEIEEFSETGEVKHLVQSSVPVSMIGSFPDTVSSVRIKIDGQVKTEFSPLFGMLYSAINLIPNRGFVGDPVKQRNELLLASHKMEELVRNKSFAQMAELLKSEIRPLILSFVKDTFDILEPSEFNQSDALRVVDSLVNRSIALKKAASTGNGFVDVIVEKISLISGERLNLKIFKTAKSISPDTGYDISVSLGDSLQKVEKLDDKTWLAESRPLTISDSSVVVRSYQFDTRLDQSYLLSIRALENEILSLQKQFEEETDFDSRELIVENIIEKKNKVSTLKVLRSRLRVLVGSPVEVLFDVN